MLQGGMYTLLKRHFSKHHYYLPTLELFHDVTLKTVMGQTLDGLSTQDGKPNFDRFTMNSYNSIVKYKSTSYTYEFPIALAMYLANVYDKETHRQAKTIVGEMGVFFQVRDDFLDCFGDAKVTGKKGNDIREGKCSWLAVVALQRANPTQRKVMEEYYGKSDPEAINIIKRLYEELNLPKTFSIYEEETFKILRTNIQQLSKGLPHKLFFKLMEGLYGSKCLE